MRVLMVPTYFGGISWWRFEVPAKALADAGHEVYCPTAYQMEGHMKQHGSFDKWIMQEMPKYDLVHAGYSPTEDFAKPLLIARDTHKVPIITDVDDNLDQVPPTNPGWRSFKPGSIGHRVARIQIGHSNGVTFSTPPTAEALKYLNSNYTVLENWVDIDSWDYSTPKERSLDKSIRLMITGGNARFADWGILQEPLEWAMSKFDGTDGKPLLRLFFLGATPDWVLPWMEDKLNPLANRCFYLQPTPNVRLFNQMVRHVAPDIILSATQKDEFNRCKSGLKFLEAALAGATFVCTDYDTYTNAPNDACLKVDNTFTQWQAALEEAITNKDLRDRLCDRAKTYVLDYCDAKMHITPRIDFYQSVLEGKACQVSQHQEAGQGATSAQPKT